MHGYVITYFYAQQQSAIIDLRERLTDLDLLKRTLVAARVLRPYVLRYWHSRCTVDLNLSLG